MTVDTVFQALREANPVPHSAAYAEYRVQAAAFLAVTRQRSDQMTTREDEKKLQQDRNTRRGRPAIAIVAIAFVAVIAVGIAMWIGFRESGDVANVPAPPFESGEDAIEAYIAAVQAGDSEAFMSLFRDVNVATWYGGTEEGIREGIRFESALYTPGAAPAPEVSCNDSNRGTRAYFCDVYWAFDPFRWKLDESVTDDLSRLWPGHARVADLRLDADGRIRYIYWEYKEEEVDAEIAANEEAFDAWMVNEHPDLVLPNDTLPSGDFEEFARAYESAIDEFIAQAEG